MHIPLISISVKMQIFYHGHSYFHHLSQILPTEATNNYIHPHRSLISKSYNCIQFPDAPRIMLFSHITSESTTMHQYPSQHINHQWVKFTFSASSGERNRAAFAPIRIILGVNVSNYLKPSLNYSFNVGNRPIFFTHQRLDAVLFAAI